MATNVSEAGVALVANVAGEYVTVAAEQLGLDARAFRTVISRTVATPPTAPAEGASYIVGASPASTWTGGTGRLARFNGGAWQFYRPAAGWKTWIVDEDLFMIFNGSAWLPVGGILENRTSDPTSPEVGRIWLRTDLI